MIVPPALFLISLVSPVLSSVLPVRPTNGITSLSNVVPTTSFSHTTTTSLSLPLVKRDSAFRCDASYFDPVNFVSSGAGEWYVGWMASIDKDGDAWKQRRSEVDFFGRQWLGTDNFTCSPSGNDFGCTGIPNCEAVVEHNGGMVDTARKALFIARSWHNANFLAGIVREVSYRLELEAHAILDDLWTDFWAPGKPLLWEQWNTQCRYLHGIAKLLKIAIHQTLMAVIPPFDPADADKTASWVDETDAAVSRAPFLWKVRNENGSFWAHRRWEKPVNPQVSASLLGHEPYNGSLDLGYRIEGACVFSPRGYEAPDRPREFVHWWSDEYRGWIDRMHALNHGAGFGWEGVFMKGDASVMAEQFRFGHFARLSPLEEERFKPENRNIIERDAWNQLKIGLITMMHSSQGCYLHCTPNPGKAPWVSLQECHNDVYKTRFCPDQNTVCQAQCWHDRGDFATPVPLYGRDILADTNNKYGIDLNHYLHASYRHYLKHHTHDGPAWRPLDDGLSREDKYFGAALPTCYTEFTRLVSTTIRYKTERNKVEANYLPCTCGNIYANETTAFFLNSGLSLNSEPTGYGDRCMRNMDHVKTPAVSAFLTMCELGYMWPIKGHDPLEEIHHARDPHCNRFKEAIVRYKTLGVPARPGWPAKKRVTDDYEIACRLCWESSVGRDIAFLQQPVVYKVTEWREMSYNFVNACKRLDRGTCMNMGVLTPEYDFQDPTPQDWPLIDPVGMVPWGTDGEAEPIGAADDTDLIVPPAALESGMFAGA